MRSATACTCCNNLLGALAALEEEVLAVVTHLHPAGELGHVPLAALPELSGALAIGVGADSVEGVLADALEAHVAGLDGPVLAVSATPMSAGALTLLLAGAVEEVRLQSEARSTLSFLHKLPITRDTAIKSKHLSS